MFLRLGRSEGWSCFGEETVIQTLKLVVSLLLIFVAGASETALAQADAGKSLGPPFSLAIRAVPSSVVPAGQKQNFGIEIVLTNLSDHPIDVPVEYFSGEFMFDATYRFDIRDSTGKQIPWVPPPTVAFIENAESHTLRPGKSKSAVIEILEFFDLSKPGSYVVQAMRRAAFKNPAPPCGPADLDEKGDIILCEPGRAMPVTADLTKGDVLSNKITITVVPANDIKGPSLSR